MQLAMSYVLLFDALVMSCVLYFALSFYRRLRRSQAQAPQAPTEHTKAQELSGSLLDPDPLWDFDLSTSTTRNHVYVNKTLRFPYYQTMSHQPMHINDWIEIDKDLKWYIDEKTHVIREQGKDVVDSLPENDAACGELLEVLVDYLPKRFPTLFERIDCKGGGIWNKVTSEHLTGLEGKTGVDALLVVSRLVQDDLLMAREREDGHVYFTGGLVAFPGFYLLSKKIGKSLAETHEPVPYFNEKLLLSVERTLRRFKPEEPFERTSWEIVDDRNLFYHNIATTERVHEKLHPKDLFFRVDHQTFRKLPRTKGIIFGVHPIMKRLEDFEDSPLVPELLVKVHREADKTLMDYKLAPLYQERMLPYLREMTARQIEKGLISGDEDVRLFRELIREKHTIPRTQTTLSVPTESELAIASANVHFVP